MLSIKNWSEGAFWDSGHNVGEIDKIFLDIDNPQAEKLFASERDPLAPAKFAAGWFEGISWEDK